MVDPLQTGEAPRRRSRGPDRRRSAPEPVLAQGDVFAGTEAAAWNGIERRRRPRRKEDVRQRLRDQWLELQRRPWRAAPDALATGARPAAALPVAALESSPAPEDLALPDLPLRPHGRRLLAEAPLVRVTLALTLHGLMLAQQLLRRLR